MWVCDSGASFLCVHNSESTVRKPVTNDKNIPFIFILDR